MSNINHKKVNSNKNNFSNDQKFQEIKPKIEEEEPISQFEQNKKYYLQNLKTFQVKQEYIETENDGLDQSQQQTRQIKISKEASNEYFDRNSQNTSSSEILQLQCQMKQEEKQSICDFLIKKDLNIDLKVNQFDLSLSQISRNYFSSKSKFYMFADLVIDLNYMRSMLYNQQEEYLKEQQKICIYKTMKHIQNIIHRIDNQYIVVQLELVENYMDNVDHIISMLQSLNDKTLYQFSQNIQSFWKNLQIYRQTIKQDTEKQFFKSHIFERTTTGDLLFTKTITELDPKKLIYFNYYKVNYEKLQLDSNCSGYSPMLQEILSGNSYAFKEYLTQQGTIDALCQQFRLTKCFAIADQYLLFYQEQKEIEYLPDIQTHLHTLDYFKIPVILKTKRIYVNHKYDQENNLNFNTHNILCIYEFVLLEDSFKEELQQARFDTKYQQILHNKENDYYRLKNKVQNIEFIKKHYENEIYDLLNKGSKWLKRCGFVDIPKKKQKKEEYRIEYID